MHITETHNELPLGFDALSLSTIVLNRQSRDRYKMYGFQEFFALLQTTIQQALAKNELKCIGTAVIMLYLC